MTSIEYVVFASYNQKIPRERKHIIVMAVIIPLVWITFIVAFVWARRLTLQPLNDPIRSDNAPNDYELGTVADT